MRRIFLTLFLLAVSLIWAGNYWNQSQVTLTQDEDADYWGFKNNHLAEYYLNNLYLEIGLNTFLSESVLRTILKREVLMLLMK